MERAQKMAAVWVLEDDVKKVTDGSQSETFGENVLKWVGFVAEACTYVCMYVCMCAYSYHLFFSAIVVNTTITFLF
jgi:hypothetical protein